MPADAASDIQVANGKPVKISIEGWRGSRLRLAQGKPDARGEGVLSVAGPSAIKVQAEGKLDRNRLRAGSTPCRRLRPLA